MNKKLLALLAVATMAMPVLATYDANYTVNDMGPMTTDLIGHILAAFINRSDVLIGLAITLIIVGLLTTLLAAIFGIFKFFKHGRIF